MTALPQIGKIALKRRTVLYAGGVAALATVAIAAAGMNIANSQWDADIGELDRVLGNDDAPVTLVEYASFTCGHCARFHADTLPALRERYVDSGVAKLVFRDFPLDGLALRASMLSHCAAPQQYFTLVEVLFATQRQWISAPDPLQALGNIGRQAGIGEADFQACMENDALAEQILRRALAAEERFGISSTPSFVINGETLIGNQPLDRFEAAIDRFAGG